MCAVPHGGPFFQHSFIHLLLPLHLADGASFLPRAFLSVSPAWPTCLTIVQPTLYFLFMYMYLYLYILWEQQILTVYKKIVLQHLEFFVNDKITVISGTIPIFTFWFGYCITCAFKLSFFHWWGSSMGTILVLQNEDLSLDPTQPL